MPEFDLSRLERLVDGFEHPAPRRRRPGARRVPLGRRRAHEPRGAGAGGARAARDRRCSAAPATWCATRSRWAARSIAARRRRRRRRTAGARPAEGARHRSGRRDAGAGTPDDPEDARERAPSRSCASTARRPSRCRAASVRGCSARSSACPQADGAILEDYGKGVLTRRLAGAAMQRFRGRACRWRSTRRATSNPTGAPIW